MSKKSPGIPFAPLVLTLVFMSGFAGLTYQVIWERTLKYFFGGDVISASIIVSVFLLGLGIGAFLFRKAGKNALALLAGVQLMIGISAMWSYEILHAVHGGLARLAARWGLGPGFEDPLVFAGTFFVLLVPTIFMGGTLPLMFESFIPKVEKNTRFIGLVYGINTLGAFLGTLVPLLFFGTLGLPGVLRATAFLSLFIGAVLAVLAVRRVSPADRFDAPAPEDAPGDRWSRSRTAVIAGFAFMTGLIALALEILFLRFIGIMHGSTAYSFPIIIASYLLSISLGSMFWSRIRDAMRPERSRFLPFFLQVVVGIVVPLTLIVFHAILKRMGAYPFHFPEVYTRVVALMETGNAGLALQQVLLFMLPPAVLVFPAVFISSGVFPTLIKNLTEERVPLARSTGIVYFSNSVGCMLGSLLAGFVFIPALGWHPSLIFLALLSVALGAAGLVYFGYLRSGAVAAPRRPAVRPAVLGLCAAATVVLLVVADADLKFNLATSDYMPGASIVAYKEGVTGVAAVREERVGDGVILHVYSGGQYMSALPNHPRHAYLAILPRLQHRFETVMLLGLGGGRSLADLLVDSRTQRAVVVDWSREIFHVVGTEPASLLNRNPLADPRVVIEMRDARNVLQRYEEKGIRFDAIIDNLCFPQWPGAGSVKSVQYFERIRRVLKPGGYYYHMNNFWFFEKELLATMAAVFPHITIHNRIMVICGETPYTVSEARVEKIVGDKRLRDRTHGLLLPVALESSPDINEAFHMLLEDLDRESLKDVTPLTDGIPATEYYITPTMIRDLLKKAFSSPARTDPAGTPANR